MLIRQTKQFLLQLDQTLFVNDPIMAIISFIEIIPIIYNTYISSFQIIKSEIPLFIKDLSYISYYDLFFKLFNNKETYPIYLFVFALLISVLFLFCKYFLLSLHSLKSNIQFKRIIINFYSYFVFRLLIIIIIDIHIERMLCKSISWNIIGTIIVFCTFGSTFFFYTLHHVYLSIMPTKMCSFDNENILLYDKYYLITKTLIAFNKHTSNNDVQFTLNFLVFAINFFSFIHQCYLVFVHRFIYVSDEYNVSLRFCNNISLMIMQIFICIIPKFNIISFICCFINSILIGFFVCIFIKKYSIRKILQNGNELGIVYYLVNEVNTQNINNIIPKVINNHKMQCKNKKCLFCHKMLTKKNNKEEIPFEKLISMLFKYLIKNQKYTASVELIDFFALYHIIELYTCYLSRKKNLIKIIMIYNKTKTLLKLSKNEVKNTKTSLFKNLTNNFLLNYELLYNEIVNRLLLNTKTNQNGNLIIIDEINIYTKEFLEKIKYFFDIAFKRPLDVIDLAKSFKKLKQKANVDFLVSKENKFTYTCILMGYIYEEIFNEQITKNYNIRELILSLEELLTYHYNYDKTILILCDVNSSLFLIKQCGKDIINVKGQHFEKIFPEYFQKEGKKRLMKVLSETQANYFEFYYHHQIKHSIEKFKMKFLGIPSLDVDNAFIYIICNYSIEKDNILIFENHYYNHVVCKVLVSCSETVAEFLKIKQKDIKKTLEDKNYICSDDLFDKETLLIDYNAIQKCLSKKLGYHSFEFSKDNKILKVSFKEKVEKYEVYIISEQKKKTDNNNNNGVHNSSYNSLIASNSKNEFNYHNDQFGSIEIKGNNSSNNLELNFTQTGQSSSARTQSSISTYINELIQIKEARAYKFEKFSKYTCYLISFNILILCVIIFFLVYELINNISLETLYGVITYYNNFQGYFYITALSVFSLACISDDLEEKKCTNTFVQYSDNLQIQLNLTSNQKVYDYIARELLIKSDYVISSLKQWESDKNIISSKDLENTLNENLNFDALEENNNTINVVTIPLTFEEAIRRFVNVVTLIIGSNDYLTSPVYPISSDGSGYLDMSNAMKSLNEQGTYLYESQKWYYTMILNYQKFILRLLSIGDILFYYFEDKVKKTLNEILVFIILFILLHMFMMGICFVFVFKFKEIHLDFFILIYKKITDFSFIKYYKEKIALLLHLLEFYKEKPNTITSQLNKIKQLELARNKNEKRRNSKEDEVMSISIQEQNNLDENKLNQIYNNHIIFSYIVQVFIIFTLYILLCIVFYFVISDSISNLSLMNKYSQGNFDISNKLYINLGLTQIMLLTNQTETMISDFFNLNLANSKATTKYISENIEETIQLIIEIDQMQKMYPYFLSINNLIDTSCDTIYEHFNDIFIEEMLARYPENDYLNLFKQFCHSLESLHRYEDPRLTMLIVTYKNKKLLEMFVDRKLETYAIISNDELIYSMYSEVLLLVRPFRRYIAEDLSKIVINNIISNYMLMLVVFLIINFTYEMFILFMIKQRIINSIISMSKEIIVVAKAFECML